MTGETLAAEPRGGRIEVIATARLQTGDLSQTLCRTRDNKAFTLPRPLRVVKRVGAGVDVTGLFCFVCLCLFSYPPPPSPRLFSFLSLILQSEEKG